MDHDPGLCNAGDRTKGLLSSGLEQCPTHGRFSEAGGDSECMGVRDQEMGPGGMQWFSRMKRKVTAGGWAETLWWIIYPDHVLTLPARPHALSEGFTRNGCGVLIRSVIATTQR